MEFVFRWQNWQWY